MIKKEENMRDITIRLTMNNMLELIESSRQSKNTLIIQDTLMKLCINGQFEEAKLFYYSSFLPPYEEIPLFYTSLYNSVCSVCSLGHTNITEWLLQEHPNLQSCNLK